ncbi:LysM domain-containing protein [Octadecabacter temperatus]|uniref:Uncharacterized protein n=1 Tax=Octadecabacter temperatus TaxID=1458307 RepID=A0A0K0Y759_9RHOB|nr:LysM domain-containing protein [Octadecabacter temperatus]AKS46799.1 hypothetical protein OSB_22630 [Octadecabacter temperatus]SIO21470.1 LysM domain-containing protein [Octadecabacter temperatus]
MRLALSLLLASASSASANTCGRTTGVMQGETYFSIAMRCDVRDEQLFAQNPNVDHNDLSIGQVINVDNKGDVFVQRAGAELGLGEDVYLQRFLGAYSPEQTCAGQELQVDLEPETVTFGETRCDIKTVIYGSADTVIANLTNCAAEGEPIPDRYASLSLFEGEMTYEYTAAYTLQRCTDR